jgi:hypothetical protein
MKSYMNWELREKKREWEKKLYEKYYKSSSH